MAMSLKDISVAMLTKNSEKYLNEVLSCLTGFDEVLLLDNGSVDNTFAIAAEFANVKVVKHEFIGFGPMKNLAAKNCKNDWIFSLDSDEVLSTELIESLEQTPLTKSFVYTLNRVNHYRKRPIKACGWYPDVLTRLYNKKSTQFNSKTVHESIEIPDGMTVTLLSGELLHYSFDGAADLLDKLQQYTTLFAVENKNKKWSSPLKALVRAQLTFAKNYFFKKGIFYGYTGFLIALCNSLGVYFKYIKLYEENKS